MCVINKENVTVYIYYDTTLTIISWFIQWAKLMSNERFFKVSRIRSLWHSFRKASDSTEIV